MPYSIWLTPPQKGRCPPPLSFDNYQLEATKVMFWRILLRIWALPYTLLGCACGSFGLATGGGWQLREAISIEGDRTERVTLLEFYGGGTAWILRCLPNGHIISAMTLGHSVIGKTADDLDRARDHEMVHVKQFEKWGPLMGPAYVGASIWVWLHGKRAYRDNPFEVEAYDADEDRLKESGGNKE